MRCFLGTEDQKSTRSSEDGSAFRSEKVTEIRLFIFLTVVLFPLLSVMLIAGYGFAIWISQMIFGPPGV